MASQVCGANCHAILQSKTQQMHSRAAAAVIAFNCTRSLSMKSTLLLTDEAETTRLMLKDLAFDELPMRNTEARGLQCDRWGHPRLGCVDATSYPKPTLRFHHQSNNEITKWNT
jgi:hypothetical protein